MDFTEGLAAFYRPHGAWGYKAKISQLEQQPDAPDVRTYLEGLVEDGWIIMTLSRESAFRVALSSMIGWRRGNRYHNDRQEPGELERIRVPVDNLSAASEREAAYRKQLMELSDGLSVLDMTYETNLRDPVRQQQTCDKIFALLGVDRLPVSTSFRKTSGKSADDTVVNVEEIVEGMSATPFADEVREWASVR